MSKRLMKKSVKKIVAFLLGSSLGRAIPDKLYLKILFKYKMNSRLDFDNPKTFNQKIQWLKIFDRNPLYTKLVDKYEVKSYVAEIIGQEYIVPTLGVWESFGDIDFSKLPEQFVLKCTHDSGGLVVCHDKRTLDIQNAQKKIEKCLKRNFYWVTREWPYKNVKPRIIAEEYLNDGEHLVPEDYKVYCINGEPKYIVVFHGRYDQNKRLSETVYNTEWNSLNISLDKHFEISDIVEPRPECLDEMLSMSRELCKGFAQIRVDFYVIKGKVYFGELTLYTAGGLQPMIPETLDQELGELLRLPSEEV